MILSVQGITVLKSLEHFSPDIYRDEAGKRTIGYGHVVTARDPFDMYTNLSEGQAHVLLSRDLQSVCDAVRPLRAKLTQCQSDALVIFVFNIGVTAFSRSTLRYRITVDDLEGAAQELGRWVFVTKPDGTHEESPGLHNRRLVEFQIWHGDYPNGHAEPESSERAAPAGDGAQEQGGPAAEGDRARPRKRKFAEPESTPGGS